MSVRLPRLLNANWSEKARLHPAALPITMQTFGVSTAQMTLNEAQPDVSMHDWMELYTINGSIGLFRVTNTSAVLRKNRVLTLRHARDTFADSVWKRPDGTNLDFTGTVSDYLAAIIAQQSTVYWQLGVCEDTATIKKSGIYYMCLSELLNDLEERRKNFYFTYDFTTWPWTLNFLRMPTLDGMEFRLSRNIEGCQIVYNDEQMCNRLYMTWSLDEETGAKSIRTYNNLADQTARGYVIEKTVDVREADVTDPDEWAADFLAERSEPSAKISVDGIVLYDLTGVEWDETQRGKMARVALPDYGVTVSERLLSIKYADAINQPRKITAELSNNLDTLSSALAQIQKTASDGVNAASDASDAAAVESYRARASEDGLRSEIGNTASEIRSELYSAESDLRSVITQTASSIRSELWAADSKLFSSITQTASIIRSEVSDAESGLYSAITQTASSIRSELWETDSKIYSSITQTASAIQSEIANAESGLYSTITQTANSIRSEVWAADSKLSSSIVQTESSIRSYVSSVENGLYSEIAQTESSIRATVSNKVDKSSVSITANSITIDTKTFTVDATTVVGTLAGQHIVVNSITAGSSTFDGTITTNGLSVGGTSLTAHSIGHASTGFVTVLSNDDLNLSHYHVISFTESGGVVTATIGVPTATSNSANFNIAATQFYTDGVAAAQTTGWNNAAAAVSWPAAGTGNAIGIVYPVSGGTTTTKAYVLSQGSWSNNSKYVYLREDSASGSAVARTEIDASSIYNDGWGAARGKVSAPSYGTGSTMSVGVPSSTVGSSSSMTFTLSCYTNYAYITYGGSNGTVVARVANPVTPASLYSGSASSNGTYYPPSGYNGFSSFTVDVPSASYSSSDLHISKSQGNVLLYLGSRVIERTASIAITSLVKSSNSNAWNITVRIDGDTDFYFTKLPTG